MPAVATPPRTPRKIRICRGRALADFGKILDMVAGREFAGKRGFGGQAPVLSEEFRQAVVCGKKVKQSKECAAGGCKTNFPVHPRRRRLLANARAANQLLIAGRMRRSSPSPARLICQTTQMPDRRESDDLSAP